MSEIEIVKDYCVEVSVYGRHLLVSPTVDVVHRFVDPQYDHLKYVDSEQGRITSEFIGQAALSEIVGLGIPQTRQRLKMTESEHQDWLMWHARESGLLVPLDDVVEAEEVPQPLELMPGDPIDAEVQKAHEHLDAEIEYYLNHEWRNGAA